MNIYIDRPKGLYWDNVEWYEQRDKEIYKDKMSGMSNLELVTKYQISVPRINKAFNREAKKHGH